MATQKGKTVEQAKSAGKAATPEYTAEELAYSGRIHYPPEGVIAAMRYAGRKMATLEEATRITETFMRKEIK